MALSLKTQYGNYFLSIALNEKESRAWRCWAGRINLLAQSEFANFGFLFSETEEKIKNFLQKRRELAVRKFRPIDDREALRLLGLFEKRENGARGLYDHAP